MKRASRFVAALTAVAFFAGCTTGGNGVRFSDLFDESAAAEGTGIQGSALVRAVVILATHDASARQRQVAEQNGRRAVAKLQARYASAETAPPSRKKPRHKKPIAAAPAPKPKTAHKHEPEPKSKSVAKHEAEPKAKLKAEPKPAPELEPEPAPRPKPHKTLPRIIAVATEKDERTDKKAAKSIMLFDTHAQKIIGNKVYDIESEPRAGDDVRFETHAASYVGASL